MKLRFFFIALLFSLGCSSGSGEGNDVVGGGGGNNGGGNGGNTCF
jgi:hypothetical protein